MSTLPRLISRYDHRTEMVFRNPPGITRYRFSGHRTLDGAFAGTVNMFTVNCGTSFRSPTIVKNKWGLIDESMRGLTRVLFDQNDYSSLSPNLPTDEFALYLRIEDEVGGIFQPPSPIYVIPPASFFFAENQTVTLAGNAPGITALPGEPHPGTAMVIVLPRTAPSISVINLNPIGSANLLVSFDKGLGMVPILPTDKVRTFEDAVNYIALASGDGNLAPFSLLCTMRGL